MPTNTQNSHYAIAANIAYSIAFSSVEITMQSDNSKLKEIPTIIVN